MFLEMALLSGHITESSSSSGGRRHGTGAKGADFGPGQDCGGRNQAYGTGVWGGLGLLEWMASCSY